MQRAKASIQSAGWKPAIKRKVGYETTDDDITEARRGIVNLNMNEHMKEWGHKVDWGFINATRDMKNKQICS